MRLFCRNPPDRPTHRCGAALSACVTAHSGSNCCLLAPLCCPLLSSDHMLCSCHLDIHQAPLSPFSAHSPLPRVRDWSTVVAACHHTLSTWHQSVLTHVSDPPPDFPERASVLDSEDPPRQCFATLSSSPWVPPTHKAASLVERCVLHALVDRNGSWRDFLRVS